MLERHLPVRRLEDTAVPLYVVAADMETREKVVLDRGDAVDALVATAAIPGTRSTGCSGASPARNPLSPKGSRRLIAEAERMTREWLPRASTWQQSRIAAAGR